MKRLFPVIALLMSVHCFGQSDRSVEPRKSAYPALKFGVIDAVVLSREQILADPKLTCKEAGCEVLGYELRITRRGKDFYGPYYITGSEFSNTVKHVVSNIDVLSGKMYFENVRVRYDGKEIVLPDDYVLEYSH